MVLQTHISRSDLIKYGIAPNRINTNPPSNATTWITNDCRLITINFFLRTIKFCEHACNCHQNVVFILFFLKTYNVNIFSFYAKDGERTLNLLFIPRFLQNNLKKRVKRGKIPVTLSFCDIGNTSVRSSLFYNNLKFTGAKLSEVCLHLCLKT